MAGTDVSSRERGRPIASISTRHEWWGYGVWGFVGAVIGISELWAVFGDPPWPTISATVNHLEELWNPTKVVVVALIVSTAVQVLTYSPRQSDFYSSRGRPRWRTGQGRLTKSEGGAAVEIAYAGLYFPLTLVVIAAAVTAVTLANGGTFVVGYVIYGLIAVALLIIPNVLAFWFAKEVPFPTLFRTIDNLDNRWHPAIMVIWSGLAVLAIHLVAYPWP
jgi:hypothetical protein